MELRSDTSRFSTPHTTEKDRDYSGRVAEWPGRATALGRASRHCGTRGTRTSECSFGEYSMTVNTTSDYYGGFFSIKFLRFVLK